MKSFNSTRAGIAEILGLSLGSSLGSILVIGLTAGIVAAGFRANRGSDGPRDRDAPGGDGTAVTAADQGGVARENHPHKDAQEGLLQILISQRRMAGDSLRGPAGSSLPAGAGQPPGCGRKRRRFLGPDFETDQYGDRKLRQRQGRERRKRFWATTPSRSSSTPTPSPIRRPARAPRRRHAGLAAIRLFQFGHRVHAILADRIRQQLSVGMERLPERGLLEEQRRRRPHLVAVDRHARRTQRVGQRRSVRVDTVFVTTASGDASATSQDSVLDLAKGWKAAEFNIFGDCCSTRANFNCTASIVVRTSIEDGSTAAPSCVEQGFTGETNNLNLVKPCESKGGSLPSIVFTEDAVGRRLYAWRPPPAR